MKVSEVINEGLSHPIIVVDVQPAYDTPKSESIIEFVNKSTGPVLMFVNAEETGITDDTISDVQQYWEETILPYDEREDWEDEEIDWSRFEIVDKGYGYFRGWMDNGVKESTIIRVIREMYAQRVSDSRMLFDGDIDDYVNWHESMTEVLGVPEEVLDEHFSVEWTSVAQLKRYNGAYIVGGGREECLREVELLMNAFNIRYKRIDSLVYG